ncbi:hypothetical protein Hamer_G016159 [Homarus americanus]|uniref:Uncharacterized protein n=1 Tax=Homarus americanus TaxID=6706 RepID=A0A8J5KD53_HOMAM|nr:hypothetical protein Hamer_G016159 [Homarus americanus]
MSRVNNLLSPSPLPRSRSGEHGYYDRSLEYVRPYSGVRPQFKTVAGTGGGNFPYGVSSEEMVYHWATQGNAGLTRSARIDALNLSEQWRNRPLRNISNNLC